MLKASKSGRFELYLETVVEGDFSSRSSCHLQLVGEYDTLEAVNQAAAAADGKLMGYHGFEFRYPEAFARVHNTLRARQAQREAAEAARRYAAEYDVTKCPF